jgi:signal transduction histidine kinase/CheY-like chemotaxis protein/HPt (histidine-containing phosphotransfer) domain-containing protein
MHSSTFPQPRSRANERDSRHIAAIYQVMCILEGSESIETYAGEVISTIGSVLTSTTLVMWDVSGGGAKKLASYPEAEAVSQQQLGIARALAEHQRLPFNDSLGWCIFRGEDLHYALTATLGGDNQKQDLLLLEEAGRAFGAAIARRRTEDELVLARDRAEEATRLKSAFLATMSHEVRTPLNAVVGLMDLLRTKPLDAEAMQLVSLAQGAGKDLLRIVGDILDFSKMEANALTIEETQYDLYELISRLIHTYRPGAEQKGLTLTVAFSNKLHHWVSGDPTRLAQVLGNLLSNAIKFTDAGHVRLTVEKRSGFLYFEVTDTGVGIPESARISLFEPFRQADESTTRRFGGTGLGLAIAHGIVQRMGGQLGFEGIASGGTRFFFELPSKAGQDEAPKSERFSAFEHVKVPVVSRNGAGTILIAEDHPVNQLLLRGFLEHLGFQVEVVGDGAAAILAASLGRYVALLIDWQMPIVDGLTAIRQIREQERDSARSRLPIIAITAHALQGDREVCLAAGADDYLAKPIRLEPLATALKRWIADEKRRGPNTINESALLDLVQAGGPGLLREVSGIYLEDAPVRLLQMRQALAIGDTRELARHAHAVKGSSAAVSAGRMHMLAGDLEARARAGEVDAAARLLDELERELTPVAQALDSAVIRMDPAPKGAGARAAPTRS